MSKIAVWTQETVSHKVEVFIEDATLKCTRDGEHIFGMSLDDAYELVAAELVAAELVAAELVAAELVAKGLKADRSPRARKVGGKK